MERQIKHMTLEEKRLHAFELLRGSQSELFVELFLKQEELETLLDRDLWLHLFGKQHERPLGVVVLRFLLRMGVSPNTWLHCGPGNAIIKATLFHVAVINEDIACVKMCIAHGSSLDEFYHFEFVKTTPISPLYACIASYSMNSKSAIKVGKLLILSGAAVPNERLDMNQLRPWDEERVPNGFLKRGVNTKKQRKLPL